VCGLYFNIGRTELRRAGCVADGIAASFEPHLGVIGATCETDEQAVALYNIALARHWAAQQSMKGPHAG
jgi:hypothetical protein